MIPKKIDSHTANELRKILRRVNITTPKVTINFNNDTVELEDVDEFAVDDLLQSAGSLSPERVKELKEEIGRMREEWNS